ncbi:MAG: PDZ domain-containing protein [Planctomycetota bacterium]
MTRNIIFCLCISLAALFSPFSHAQDLVDSANLKTSVSSKVIETIHSVLKEAMVYLDGIQQDKGEKKSEKNAEQKKSSKSKASLGIYIEETDEGVRVVNLPEKSPAGSAGVEVEDIVIRVNDRKIESIADIQTAMEGVVPGDSVKIIVRRDDEKVACKVKTNNPEDVFPKDMDKELYFSTKELKAEKEKFKKLNEFLKSKKNNNEAKSSEEDVVHLKEGDFHKVLRTKNIEHDKATLGIFIDSSEGNVKVLDMPKGSPAEIAGIEKGDVIFKVNGDEIVELNDLGKIMEKVAPGDQVVIGVKRDGKRFNYKVNTSDHMTVFENVKDMSFDAEIDDCEIDDCDAECSEQCTERRVREFKLPGMEGAVKVMIRNDDDECECLCPKDKVLRIVKNQGDNHSCDCCSCGGHDQSCGEKVIKIYIYDCRSDSHCECCNKCGESDCIKVYCTDGGKSGEYFNCKPKTKTKTKQKVKKAKHGCNKCKPNKCDVKNVFVYEDEKP